MTAQPEDVVLSDAVIEEGMRKGTVLRFVRMKCDTDTVGKAVQHVQARMSSEGAVQWTDPEKWVLRSAFGRCAVLLLPAEHLEALVDETLERFGATALRSSACCDAVRQVVERAFALLRAQCINGELARCRLRTLGTQLPREVMLT